jgi:hypothetical protein
MESRGGGDFQHGPQQQSSIMPRLISGAGGAVTEELVGAGDDDPVDERDGTMGAVPWGGGVLVANGRSAAVLYSS